MIAAFTLLLAYASLNSGKIPASAERKEPASAASFPLACEVRQKAWCIHQGSVEITSKQAMGQSYTSDHTWVLQEMHRPTSLLVIFEPVGCRKGLADTVEPIGHQANVPWSGRSWHAMSVRLRQDGSCDLRLLVLPPDRDPSDWGFRAGRLMISACKDADCTPNAPTIADVTRQYEQFISPKH